jgi:hypothetical protein
VTVAAPDAAGTPVSGSGPVRRRFGRRKFDRQPGQPAAVLIASNGVAVPGAAVRLALRMGHGEPVAVVSIARLYGSGLGLQNPGLMPTRKEMAEQKESVEQVVRALEKAGTEAWGQVAITRRPAKTIAAAARARGVGHVIVVRPEQPVRWRQVVEGDLVKEVSRKLGPGIEVEGVSP